MPQLYPPEAGLRAIAPVMKLHEHIVSERDEVKTSTVTHSKRTEVDSKSSRAGVRRRLNRGRKHLQLTVARDLSERSPL